MVMWFILGLVLFIAAIHIILPKKYQWPSTMKKINKIPGPKGLPFVGNALTFTVSNEEFIPLLTRLKNQFQPIWKTDILGHLFVFITDLDDLEVILNSRSHITKGTDYEYLIPWLGTGLLLSTGKKWFDHRKWLTPAFHFTILEQYVEIMNKNSRTLCQLLNASEKITEINSFVSNCALDIICETAMGTQINAQLGGEVEYVKSVIRMSQIFMQRSLSPWLSRQFIFNMSPLGRENNRVQKKVHKFTKKVIKERQLAYKEKKTKNENNVDDFDIGGKKKMSFLDLLIEISHTENRLTEEEIREEVDTFMFEGHDTTAAAVIWALFELGLNPEIQEKVYQEQCEIFKGSDRNPNFSDLQEMKYLERVIKETLRLYPSVPVISRKLEEEIKIRNYVIPAGTQTPILIYHIHRDPDIYPEPEKFNPDRFLADFVRDRHPFSYIPFSAGPRNCIGQKFAMMEEKVMLSHVTRNFRFTTLQKREDVKVVGEVVLRPKEKIKMTFNTR